MTNNLPTFGVKSLSLAIKKMLESSYSKIYIKGQVSQPKRMNHLYFSLKEEDAVIDCIAWANAKLSFEPQHDMEIICCGRVSSYPGRSKYQMVVLSVEHIGDSQVLEKRKLALQKEGLFDISRKLKLPKYPKKVGIITSPVGAVLHDMLHRLRDRCPCKVVFYPVSVQGAEMANSVINAIKYFNSPDLRDKNHEVDLLIVARGGGSFEDLWGFQDEDLVRAIANTKIPLITAIGHETDTTLADYASSCRAPTPTAAIELAFPDKKELCIKLENYESKIKSSILFYIENKFKNKLLTLRMQSAKEIIKPLFQDFKSKIAKKDYAYNSYWNQKYNEIKSIDKFRLNLNSLQKDLIHRIEKLHSQFKQFISNNANLLEKRIDAMKSISYEDTLKRGFCRATVNGKLIKNKSEAPDKFNIEFQDGSLLVKRVE
ncbi:exodeoxyribonuclease VII large subunit [Candidatus Cytomitobacter indipagum]|uniref:Exodeoxyribonuclease 7 large subunit n=1 Tax=Candidatus Cytomitobacter indipagum TaxID=2601575 RepID=A0A5C0UD95_9PROT|nr:exodeoxyribonuclease VII large subunit [Candidatus Cytomitobacter indipagum]QEK38005.1 exodeoxyribonuclease VII large subunit [Candidatus Cytomitobacter indipagum]